MSNPSLGELLHTQLSAKKALCPLELERNAAQKGLCAERDLQEVKNFFHQAITQFTTDILARIEVRPRLLGNGQNEAVATILQTYRWKRDNGIQQASHPYHAIWQNFANWCAENDLEPELAYRCDGIGKVSWHELTVKPALAQSHAEPQALRATELTA